MKIAVSFCKTKAGIYISHLDLMRLFQRASRRAEIPIAVSQGFSPHLKISIKQALKVGVESFNEQAVFQLNSAMAPETFLTSMNKELPEGIKIHHAEIVQENHN